MSKSYFIVFIIYLLVLAGCDTSGPEEPAVVLATMSELGAGGEVVQVANLTTPVILAANIENSFKKTINIPGISVAITTSYEANGKGRNDHQLEPVPVFVMYLFVQEGELPQVIVYTIDPEPGVWVSGGIQGGSFKCGEDEVCAGTIYAFMLMNKNEAQDIVVANTLRTGFWGYGVNGDFGLVEQLVLTPDPVVLAVMTDEANVSLGSVSGPLPSNGGRDAYNLIFEASTSDPGVIPFSLVIFKEENQNYRFEVFPGTVNGTPLISYATKDKPWMFFKSFTFVRMSSFSIRIPDV